MDRQADPIDQYEDLIDPLTGKTIKSGFGTDFFRGQFNERRKPRPNAVNLTFLSAENGFERSNVYDLMFPFCA